MAYSKGHIPCSLGSFEEYWAANGASFVKRVERCVLVNSFYWCVWAIMLLPHDNENVCNDDAWQWAFVKGRNETFIRQRKEFNI